MSPKKQNNDYQLRVEMDFLNYLFSGGDMEDILVRKDIAEAISEYLCVKRGSGSETMRTKRLFYKIVGKGIPRQELKQAYAEKFKV